MNEEISLQNSFKKDNDYNAKNNNAKKM